MTMIHMGTLVSGLIFTVLGGLLLLDALELFELELSLLGPIALIAVGLTLLAGWVAREHRS